MSVRWASPKHVAAAACLLVWIPAAGCNNEPAGPTHNIFSEQFYAARCQPAGPAVTCQAMHLNQNRDLTASATWTAQPAGLGTFTAPGVFVPTARGEVTIRFEYQGRVSSNPPIFLVDPAETARELRTWSFWTREVDGTTPIGGVTISVINGYRAGSSCTTLNSVCTIERMLTGEDFDASASKPGYVTTAVEGEWSAVPIGSSANSIVLLPRSQ